MRSLQTRLFAKRHINPETDCWEWQGAANKAGYGRIMVEGRRISTHRLAAEIWLGLDPDSDMQVCHDCDNPKCFNPDHLFLGTPLENMRDKVAKGRGVPPDDPRLFATAKLTPEQVRRIRTLRGSGKSLRYIGQMFDISYETVRLVAGGRSWKHLLN